MPPPPPISITIKEPRHTPHAPATIITYLPASTGLFHDLERCVCTRVWVKATECVSSAGLALCLCDKVAVPAYVTIPTCHHVFKCAALPPYAHTHLGKKNKWSRWGEGGVNNNMPERRQPARQSCSDWLGSGWRLAQLTNISHQAWRRLHTHAAFCGKTMGCSLRFWGTEIQGTAKSPRTDHNARQLCGSHRHPGNMVRHRNVMRAENFSLMWISGAAENPMLQRS